MGKALSRQSPCCSKKPEREGYNEDGYIPQRSIYDTMCINEHIDHSSGHSTLGSRRGRETDFSSNGSLGADLFDNRSSMPLTSGRRLDERFIFDSLKLANDELRSSGGFVRSASPSVSCSSAPSGSVNKRHHHQDGGKKDSLCRHSWKVLAPPKLPEPLELSPGERNFLNPGVAFFPSSMTSPQISPFSGSPFSTGTHTPSVFFSPSPLPYHQQFHRQSLPTQPSSPRPPFSELSVNALMCVPDIQEIREKEQRQEPDREVKERCTFGTFKPRPVEPIREQQTSTPEPENDTAPLLHPQVSKSPKICTTSMESTWPRRLIGRRRTVRQGGAIHNLPILPPLPSLLIRSVSDKKPMPRLSPFPEHQGKVEGQLSKSLRKNELKDFPLQEWKLLRDTEERKSESSRPHVEKEEVLKERSKIEPVQQKAERSCVENTPPESEENWEAVLEMVNSLWDETWNDSDSQNLGSLRRWPVLSPPTGFGGSQAPSTTSSELGPEDLLELERLCREDSIDSELNDFPQCLSDSRPKEIKNRVVIKQPTSQPYSQRCIPKTLDLKPSQNMFNLEFMKGSQGRTKYGPTDSPDSNLTLDSDSSGVYMSSTSQTSRDDVTSDGDRSLPESDFVSVSLPYRAKNIKIAEMMGLVSHEPDDPKQLINNNPAPKCVFIKRVKTKDEDGSVDPEICNTVNTKTDGPLPLSPSKHQVRATLLDSGDLDPFVTTDSFVYLSVVPPPKLKDGLPNPEDAPTVQNKPTPQISFMKPSPYPDECDFLSTDSFVYLAAPDCHLLVAERHSVYGDSRDSDSEDSGSRAEFVQPSTVGDSDWDSDLSDSDHEWDYWEELEQDVLQGLFCEDKLETDCECHGNQAWQSSRQRAELEAFVQNKAGVSSQHAQGAERPTEIKSVT